MPKIEVIKASDAPGKPIKQSKYAEELLAAISSLKKDEVLKLAPDDGKTIRGLKTGIGRVSKTAGVKITQWDDGESVYISKG